MKFVKRLNSAHALAAAALFVALSGSAYAVTKNSVTSKQVKDNSLSGKDIRDNGLSGSDIDEATLQIAAGASSSTATGPAGGALIGAYPNPGLAPNSVGGDQIAANAVDSSELTANSVSSAEVEDGSLNGVDVGKVAGTVADFNPPAIGAGECLEVEVDLGATTSISDDAFAVTMGTGWAAVLSATPETSPTLGRLRMNICNHQTNTVDQGPVELHWVAFDV
jgi:hypothetical protein